MARIGVLSYFAPRDAFFEAFEARRNNCQKRVALVCISGQRDSKDARKYTMREKVTVVDAAGLRRALSKLPSQGGEIVLRSGSYLLTSELVIDTPNVTLRGAAAGAATINFDPSTLPIAIRVEAAGFEMHNIVWAGITD
jgi:hypothetical protein